MTPAQLRQMKRDRLLAVERRKAVSKRRYERQYARRHGEKGT